MKVITFFELRMNKYEIKLLLILLIRELWKAHLTFMGSYSISEKYTPMTTATAAPLSSSQSDFGFISLQIPKTHK